MFRKFLCAVTVAGMLGAAAWADVTGHTFEIVAESNGEKAAATWDIGAIKWNDATQSWYWELRSPRDLETDEGRVLATLDSAQIEYHADPVISIGFSVQAGSSDTTFTITSGLLSFPTINSPEGQAGCGFTVTDTDNTGATLTPGNPAGSAYLAQYNGQAPGGSTFADLITSPLSSDPGKSASTDDNYPASGYVGIGTPVDDMSVQVRFTLTANDLGSGTNSFEIVPEPAAFSMLALAIGLIRRR